MMIVLTSSTARSNFLFLLFYSKRVPVRLHVQQRAVEQHRHMDSRATASLHTQHEHAPVCHRRAGRPLRRLAPRRQHRQAPRRRSQREDLCKKPRRRRSVFYYFAIFSRFLCIFANIKVLRRTELSEDAATTLVGDLSCHYCNTTRF